MSDGELTMKYVSIFNNTEIVRIQLRVSYKNSIVNRIGEEGCTLINREG
jgi:hypothetical protein